MKRLIFLMLIPLVSFGQFGETKKSLAPTDSVGNLKRTDTTWVAYKSWVEGQGYGSGSGGDTTGMLTRTDTSWVATRFALNSYVAQSETTAWLPSWSDILALHYLLPSDSANFRGYSNALYALVGHNHSGTYLTPSDSNTIRAYSNALYALEGHNHTGTYQPAGTYLVPSDTNLVVKRTDTTWVAYKEWVTGQGYGIGTGDIEGVGVTAPITGGGTTGSVTIGIDTTAALAYAKALIAGKLSVSDSTTFLAYVKSLIAGKQAAGIYLIPSDTSGMMKRVDTSWTVTEDELGGYQPIGTYLVPSDTNLVLKRTDTTWVAYKEWVEGQGYSTTAFDSAAALAYIKYLDGLKLPLSGGTLSGLLSADADVVSGTYHWRWYLRMSNKAQNGWLDFATANSAGSEVVADLNYVGTLNGQSLIATETSVGSIPYMEDATTLGTVTVGGALDMDGATLNLATRTLYSAGLIDSVKTTDTLFVGLVYPAATLSSIVYSSARACFYKVRLEIVDSLYQTANPTLLDTMSCIYQRNNKSAAVGGGTFSISAGKIVRAVFESVGIMPKQFNVSLVGTN